MFVIILSLDLKVIFKLSKPKPSATTPSSTTRPASSA